MFNDLKEMSLLLTEFTAIIQRICIYLTVSYMYIFFIFSIYHYCCCYFCYHLLREDIVKWK